MSSELGIENPNCFAKIKLWSDQLYRGIEKMETIEISKEDFENLLSISEKAAQILMILNSDQRESVAAYELVEALSKFCMDK